MESEQTREAAWVLHRAHQREREHWRGCAECQHAAYRRQPGRRCHKGWLLAEDRRELAIRFRVQRTADKSPPAGTDDVNLTRKLPSGMPSTAA